MATETRVSAVTIEVLNTNTSAARVSTVAVEVLRADASVGRLSQVAVEVLRPVATPVGTDDHYYVTSIVS